MQIKIRRVDFEPTAELPLGAYWLEMPVDYYPSTIEADDVVRDEQLRVVSFDEQFVVLPTADDLDTGGWTTGGYHLTLYLEPAKYDEPAYVRVYGGFGRGEPEPAFNQRWCSLYSYGVGVLGASVLEVLEAIQAVLCDISACYKGDHFDGSKRVGQWNDRVADLATGVDRTLCEAKFKRYHDAADWFSAAAIYWPDLCAEAGIDPERALQDDWRDVAREVAAIVEPLQDEPVSGTVAYAIDMADDYRRSR